MNELWLKISYMVQLIAASLIFMHPIKKRKRYPVRAALGAFILLAVSYAENSIIGAPESLLGAIIYWAAFPLLMIPYVLVCAEAPLQEVLATVVFASAAQHVTCNIFIIYEAYFGQSFAVFLLIFAVFYSLFYCLFALKLAKDGHYLVNRSDLVPMATIMLFVIVLSVIQGFAITSREGHAMYFLSDGLCCIYILWQQVAEREKLDIQRELDGVYYLWNQQKSQYEVTQETIDTINRKCHDLKHQIRAICKSDDSADRMAYFEELENAVEIYDTAVKTGNAALDTVLMEKGLYCKSHGIQLTSLIDGAKLNSVDPADIYAMFGNALDNAIFAVLPIEDENRRIISMNMLSQGELIVIQIQNYYDGELVFVDGLPETTQNDKTVHGYGMKSLRFTAEKYNGMIDVGAENGIFTLTILLPVLNGA